MLLKDYIDKIKSIKWDNRVQRPGFIQSKQIVTLAVCKKINITQTISIQETDNIWINTSALYSDSFNGTVKILERAK